MQSVYFEGAKEIKKPGCMTDEECMSVWAMPVDINYPHSKQVGHMWVEAYQPSKEDIEAINNGRPIWIQIHSIGLPPIAVFTLDENWQSNDAG